MLIGKKCDFKCGEVEYTGIIVEKYIDNSLHSGTRSYYIIDTGEKLEHIPCLRLTKIHNESVPVINSKETIVTKSEDKGLVYGGKIAHLPIEIVERMLIEQELQGNPRNVSVFEEFGGTNRYNGGFNWYQCNDGEMWSDVFLNYNFTKFYEKYPKTN